VPDSHNTVGGYYRGFSGTAVTLDSYSTSNSDPQGHLPLTTNLAGLAESECSPAGKMCSDSAVDDPNSYHGFHLH